MVHRLGGSAKGFSVCHEGVHVLDYTYTDSRQNEDVYPNRSLSFLPR